MSPDDAAFLDAVTSGVFPLAQWNHRAHVRVAYLYLSSLPLAAAIVRMRSTIQAYNAAHQVPEALDRGYHETITQAFLRVIHGRLNLGVVPRFDQFCDENADLLDRKLLLRFYSRDRLMSAEAKREFILPDLLPLDSAATVSCNNGLQEQPIAIRAECAADASAIRMLTVTAFAASPLGYHGEAELIDRLREVCRPFISLVAARDTRIVGQILLTPVTLVNDQIVVEGMGLGPVSVTPEFQRRGIGTRLIRAGLTQLSADESSFVVVLGDPRYYERFGFVPARAFGITCEFAGIPEDAFQILWFDRERAATRSGIVHYHPAFSDVERRPAPIPAQAANNILERSS